MIENGLPFDLQFPSARKRIGKAFFFAVLSPFVYSIFETGVWMPLCAAWTRMTKGESRVSRFELTNGAYVHGIPRLSSKLTDDAYAPALSVGVCTGWVIEFGTPQRLELSTCMIPFFRTRPTCV